MTKRYFTEGDAASGSVLSETCGDIQELERAMNEGAILEGRAVVCDAFHNLHVEIGKYKGVIPKEEALYSPLGEPVKDIAVITRVGKNVCFKITEIEKTSQGVRLGLSRRLAQKECFENYIKYLRVGDVIDATVTHMENFGVFCDIGCGISALLPIDGISVSRIPHPAARLRINESIKTIVRNIDEQGRITLTSKELLGTWEENAAMFSVGETGPGIVRSVENYGIFVELTPNLAGLAELTEGIEAGQHCSVFIKNIIPEKMKLKLIIVDSFAASYPEPKTKYFFAGTHIDRFIYSPDCCPRKIESVF